jgi:hypothetical protein
LSLIPGKILSLASFMVQDFVHAEAYQKIEMCFFTRVAASVLYIKIPKTLIFRHSRKHVMPAKAGIQRFCLDFWTPAFAGVTAEDYGTKVEDLTGIRLKFAFVGSVHCLWDDISLKQETENDK